MGVVPIADPGRPCNADAHGHLGKHSPDTHLWSASFADPLESLGFASPEIASRNILQCGAAAVEVRYDVLADVSPSPTLVVHGTTEDQLPCINTAVGFYDVELPPELQKGFDAIRLAQYMTAYRKRAAAALTAQGLLDDIPKFALAKRMRRHSPGNWKRFVGPLLRERCNRPTVLTSSVPNGSAESRYRPARRMTRRCLA